ncbi:M24 family metallopeptidase [Kurthia huakuii]|uniref:M24 family metallopeptidase n=1 Tax=Kurthia huakuii TaxID=1421019 RepID=UPI00049733FA|nr:Xaa-Pro peptidase family protein [Kurthia huakuii]MBM7698043.1 Xaa-Pro aminopeptidase [Kurthia huakuii]
MKIRQLRAQFDAEHLDAMLITNPINVSYLSGFTGDDSYILVTANDMLFFTDSRYTEQVKHETTGFRVVERRSTLLEEVVREVKELQLKHVGFEKEYVTYATFQLFDKYIDAQMVGISGLVEKLRLIKTPEELTIIKAACSIVDKTFEHIIRYIEPGMTELQVSNEMEHHMRKLGAKSSSFDTIVASGWRSALPHGTATDKIIATGDIVTLDFGALYNGYISDTTRTIAVGEPSAQLKEIYDIVLQAQLRGVDALKPGMTGIEADAVARDYITEHGYGEAFGHSTGHGIGREVHEAPALSHRSSYTLEAGMCVTCEPGIYIPEVGGVRIEDDILITDTGHELLTHATKDLIIL